MKNVSIIIAVLLSAAVLAVSIITAAPNVQAEEESVEETESKTEPAMAMVEIPAPEPEPEPEPEPKPLWHFFNLDLQGDGEKGNEYNFGCEPDCEMSPEAMDIAFRNRLKQDPPLGAADMASFDAKLGTRYLGVFYDECDEEWDRAINKAKTDWVNGDPEEYYKTLDSWFDFLDSAVSVEIREQKDIVDQMYMNPFTIDGVPDVIVMETDDHTGHFLVYTFKIKNTKKVEVAYRIECGFQPCNVAETMKIKPQKRSGGGGGGGIQPITGGGGKPTINGGGPKPTSTPTPEPTPTSTPKPTPTPTPTPTSTPKKDSTQGSTIIPNDNSGSGENTNNPANPNHSTKEPPNSSITQTPQETQQAIQQIEEANKDAGGGDTPSTPPPTADTTVDSGAAEASEPTETTEKVEEVKDDSPGDSWDGPPE